ncbi:MAG TPA: low molecular weight phosphatase family protein [Candidatus Saccharimonadales bacterium]|jgi:protein-tyrosine-phosphatase
MNILFICNANVARSQEAEAFLNDLSEDDIATSAGINVKVGKPIDPLVIEVMKEADFSLKNAKRKLWTEDMIANAGLIVSFKPENELPVELRNSEKIRYWHVEDPQHQPIEFHRKIRDEVRTKVSELVSELDG